MGDQENLEAFATSGCERAFRALVESYANLVFSAALRRTLGNRELAEEVAQNVFAIMARKARRRGWIEPQGLAPWLHRTAVLESANARRKEQRRRLALERLANETMTTQNQNLPQPALDELDAAIDGLPDSDRSLLMMHYFDGLSYREVAEATGKSEAASRKQASRALEKLGRSLGKRGITLSSVAIGSMLAVKLTEAAPAAVGKSLAGAALAGAGSVPTLTIIQNTLNTMAYAKTKTAVAVAIIAAIPLVSQWNNNRELNDRLTSLEASQNLMKADSGNPAGEPKTDRRGVPRSALSKAPASGAAAISGGSVFGAWQDALLQADPLKRSQELAKLTAELTAESAPEALEAFLQARKEGGDFRQEMRLFMRAWGSVDGAAAIAEALTDRHGNQNEQAMLAQSVLGGWAAKDPGSAVAWIEAQEPGGQTEQYVLGLIDGWSTNDFDAAAAFAETRPRSEARDHFIELLLRRAILSGGVPAAQSWFAGIPDGEHNEIYKRRAFNGVVQAMLNRDPAEAAAWIAANSDQAFVSGDAVASAADNLALQSPDSAMDWVNSLEGLGEEVRATGVGRVFERWMLNDLNDAGIWLGQNQDSPEYDNFATQYAMRLRREDAEAARAWADTISDENVRTELLANLENQDQLRVSSIFYETDRFLGDSFNSEILSAAEGEIDSGIRAVDLVTSRNSASMGDDPTTLSYRLSDSAGNPEIPWSRTLNHHSTHPAITGAASCTQCHSN